MGLFSSNKSGAINWTNLTSEQQLNELVASSSGKAVAIFKHSTRCNISSMVKSRLENKWKPDENVIPVYLDLLSYRSLSDRIAQMTGIRHESPQMIVFRNGEPVYSESHVDIDADELTQTFNESK